jgi:hypothetical protein
LEILENRTLLSLAGWPDLAVENLSVPASAVAGNAITIEYDLVNHGDAAFRAGGVDYLYWGTSARPSLKTAPTLEIPQAGEIPAGGTLHVTQEYTPALSESGRWYVVVLANPFEKVGEGKQLANNLASAAVTVTAVPAADLAPISIAADVLAGGQAAHVIGTVTNNGANTAIGGWSDEVYLSSNSTWDAKDILLGRVLHAADVPAGGSYTIDFTATVPPEAVGDKYLILKADADAQANETAAGMANNRKAAAMIVKGAVLVNAYDGMFLARSANFKLKMRSYSDRPGTILSMTLDNFSPLPVLPECSGADLPLLWDLRLADGAKNQTLTLNPAGAALGTYRLTVTASYKGTVVSQQTLDVTVVDDVLRKNDKLGDAIGGLAYEIYNMEIGRAGDSLLFRVGTNYDGADGDFRLVTGKLPAQSVFGIALGDRQTASGYSLTGGDLYTGATFAPGQTDARYPALIDTYGQQIAGESFVAISDHQGYGGWKYDLLAGVNIDQLGPLAPAGVTVSWTMYCGNDYQQLTYKKTLPLAAWIAKNIHSPAVTTSLTAALAGDYQLDRGEMIDILQAPAADNAVDKVELADLKTVVKNALMFGAPDSVRVLAGRVVNGDAANRHYQGKALGNLHAGSTTTQMADLIGKWFLGDDHPQAEDYGYTLFSGSLFQGGVSYQDIDQGTLGDCYFLTALADIAYNSPETIQNMFVDNGDGTYAVGFRNGKSTDWVTVDRYFPAYQGAYLTYAGNGDYYNNASNELWAPLAEKAYAQWADSHRSTRGSATSNSYADIDAGYVSDAVKDLTGRKTVEVPSLLDPISNLNTRDIMIGAYDDAQWIWVSTDSFVSNPNLVEDHTYALVNYDSSTQVFTLFNPWGIDNGQAPGLVELTWSQLQADCTFWGTTL